MQRTPVRELTDRHKGQRGYFHRPPWLTRLKGWLALAALGLACLGVTFDLMFFRRWASAHTHGPLAAPHARWEANCTACHSSFAATDVGVAWSLFNPEARWRTLTCEKCHPGPRAHAALNAEGEAFHAQCANCHHDHAGRAASLVRLSDDHCVRCHGDLASHRQEAGTGVSDKVTGLGTDHPEFAVLKRAPRRLLKFNHGLHMTPGLVYTKDARGVLTVARLEELSGKAAAAAYSKPGQAADAPITLDCSSCHQKGAEPAEYQPIRFDAHCKACHPIKAPAGISGGAVVPGFEIPHGRQLSALKEVVAGEYSRRLMRPDSPAMAAPLGPGGRFDPRLNPALATFKAEVDRLTLATVPALGCARCHDVEGAPPRVVEPMSHQAWLPAARFTHAAHRAMTCQECHAGTEASYSGTGLVAAKEPIRIPGVESCRQCHAPAEAVPRHELAGARHGCTDCHRYHNGNLAAGRSKGRVPVHK